MTFPRFGDGLGYDRGEAVERTLRLLVRVRGSAAGEDGQGCPGERADSTPEDGVGYAASGGPSVHVVLPLRRSTGVSMGGRILADP
ncbi:hypothetical protein CTI14_40180, partial [Methylobacterium radiotolerans]